MFRLLTLLALGRYEEAIRHSDSVTNLFGARRPGVSASSVEGYALARLGRRMEAVQVPADLRKQAFDPAGEALVLHGFQRDDEALRRLQDAVNDRALAVTFLGVYPWWDDFRGNTKFRALLSQLNLLETSDQIRR